MTIQGIWFFHKDIDEILPLVFQWTRYSWVNLPLEIASWASTEVYMSRNPPCILLQKLRSHACTNFSFLSPSTSHCDFDVWSSERPTKGSLHQKFRCTCFWNGTFHGMCIISICHLLISTKPPKEEKKRSEEMNLFTSYRFSASKSRAACRHSTFRHSSWFLGWDDLGQH